MLFDMDNQGIVEPKFRKQLNQSQLAILMSLYKFRFGTTELLAINLGKKNGATIHPRLVTLERQGFIARRFEDSYRLKGKHASYYLRAKGLRALQAYTERDDIDEKIIKASYKDKSVTDQFISHCLAIYTVSNCLSILHPATKLFTKRELTLYDYFPNPLPDAYISLKVDTETRRFFLEVLESSTPSFVIDRWIRQLIKYQQDATWQAKGNLFPTILCVCESGSLERRIRKQINRAIFRADSEMLFCTTTLPALTGSDRGDDKIWSSSDAPDILYSLDTISVNP